MQQTPVLRKRNKTERKTVTGHTGFRGTWRCLSLMWRLRPFWATVSQSQWGHFSFLFTSLIGFLIRLPVILWTVHIKRKCLEAQTLEQTGQEIPFVAFNCRRSADLWSRESNENAKNHSIGKLWYTIHREGNSFNSSFSAIMFSFSVANPDWNRAPVVPIFPNVSGSGPGPIGGRSKVAHIAD